MVGMPTERIWKKVDKDGPNGCWLWMGYVHAGYGRYGHGPGTRLAHRIVYEMMRGPVAEGLDLDHLCRVRHCVNPDHLEPVTHRENILRGEGVAAVEFRQTHCIRGHEFTPENTYVYRNGRARRCNECHRAANREWWRSRRAADNSD